MYNILGVAIPLFIPIFLLILGVLLCLVEIFSPGFGVFGIIGLLALLTGIILRAVSGASMLEIVVILILLVVFFGTFIFIGIKSAKKGKLSKSALILSQTSVDEKRSLGTPDFDFLIGKEGETSTFLRPIGKCIIDGEEYEVISELSKVVEKGSLVVVTRVEGVKVYVKTKN